MTDNTKKQTDGQGSDGSGQTAGENTDTGGDPGDGESAAERGLKKALIDERKKRQRLEEKISALTKRKEQRQPRLDGLEVTDDDLAEGKAAPLNDTFKKLTDTVNAISGRLNEIETRGDREEVSGRLEGVLDEYSIFEDSEVGELAQDSMMAHAEETVVDGEIDMEKFRALAEKTSKTFSKLKVNASGSGDGDGENGALLAGSGDTAAAAHMKEKRPQTVDAARKAAPSAVSRIVKKFRGNVTVGS